MLVIVSGRVRISVISEDGKEVTLSILGAGEVLGEMSLLDGDDCSADATAQEDCVLPVIERGQFLRLLRANSDLTPHLMAILTAGCVGPTRRWRTWRWSRSGATWQR